MAEGAFEVVMFDLVEAVHVELPYETVDFIMPKVLRQDQLLKFIDILDDELASRWRPIGDLIVLVILHKARGTLRI